MVVMFEIFSQPSRHAESIAKKAITKYF